MNNRKLQIILVSLLALLTISTVAYAYAGQAPGSSIPGYRAAGQVVQELTGLAPKPAKPTLLPASQPVPANKPLQQILAKKGIHGQIPNFKIVVDKSDHSLTLYSGAAPLKAYPISLGGGGLGDKVRAGDHKTPEGQFYISESSVLAPTDKFLGSRWMRVSYPNKEDADRGLASGLIDQATRDRIYAAINNKQNPPQNTALGGGVGIHGGVDANGKTDWTYGCMALSEADVQEIFEYIGVGTSLYIQS
ncbi:MAG: L,D-transpeptidase [Thermincola sp.]|nr:L,D-transpeptidase [Thermincola sp.]MDT3701715.1 L,D-transpeptidase [Thermincola sp.]